MRVFAHNARGMTSSWVEVSQKRSIPFLGFVILACFLGFAALGVDLICDAELDGEFCVTIRVCGAERALFGNGNHVGKTSSVAVDGGGGREDDVGHAVSLHAAEETYCAVDVGVVVVEGSFGGFAHCLSETG